MKNNKKSVPERFCILAVRLILIAILLFLTAVSILVTCSVHGGSEVMQYGRDNPLVHIIVLTLVLGGGAAIRIRKRNKKEEAVPAGSHAAPAGNSAVYRRILTAAAGIYVLWVLITLFGPTSDQRLSLESAQALLNGNLTPWAPLGFGYRAEQGVTGYAFTYPSQNGLILFFAMVSFVFRSLTPYVLQIMNIGFLFLGMYCLCRLCAGIFSLEHMRGTMLLLIGFLPFAFYITFVYGTIPGFCLSSAALYFEYSFLKTGRWRYFCFSAACICGAVLLKSNYLIVLAAMVIYFLTWGLFHKSVRFFGAAVLLVLLYVGSGKIMNLSLEAVTGEPVSKGSPMLAWVEMGLQDGSRAPGWYNGYNVRVFSENELDTERTTKAVKADLKETIDGFLEEPDLAAEFFLKKAASLWAEPTFQSLWVQEVKGDSWLIPGFTQSLFQENGLAGRIYAAFFNLAQTLVYAGALLYFLLKGKDITWEELVLGVVFIGGFLFHMVWEAKGQYSVCYFILLIPYAVMGIRKAADGLAERIIRLTP